MKEKVCNERGQKQSRPPNRTKGRSEGKMQEAKRTKGQNGQTQHKQQQLRTLKTFKNRKKKKKKRIKSNNCCSHDMIL